MSADLKERATDVLDASYASLFSELSGTFRARGLTTEEARDFAQESLVRTFVHLKRHGQTRPDLRPLAHTIAKRLYVERGRRARPQFVDLPQAEEVVDPAPQPAEAVVAMEEQRDVQAALRALGPRHRHVISLWMGGLRPAEIASELGIKRNAADALLHRARRQLATKLDPSRTAFGLIGVFVLRLRLGLRRFVGAVANIDPSGSTMQAGAGLAAAGIAAVLLVAGPAGHGSAGADGHPQGVTGRSEISVPALPSQAAPPGAPSVVKPPDRIDRVESRFTLGADIGPGNDEEAETWLVYRDDGNERPSRLAPVVDPLMAGTCRAVASVCQDTR